uniref:NADH-ubiquinone oxidoreductase chain 4 n=1 Tax=Quadristernoseta cf. longigynium XFX-2019 TaxID=2695872 RepID=A0A6B9WE88_9ACAR|nr:NADH dehydrogenase subunit 4 [Quadristernoseta cf. longigynium XFX-2019]
MLGIMLMLLLSVFFNYLWLYNFSIMFLMFFFIFMSDYLYLGMFFCMDHLSYLMNMLSLWICFLMGIAMYNVKGGKESFLYVLMVLMLCFLLLCFSMVNMMGFYIFFEAVLLPIVFIILYWGNNPDRVQASFYMFMYTVMGSLPLLLMLLYLSKFNSLSYMYLFMFKFNVSSYFLIFFILAFLIKMPMYMFHLWLPKAHVEAPVGGSMILAGVLLKLGGYGMYRVLDISWLNSLVVFYVLMGVSLVGGMIVSVVCLRQVDMKMLIAYSSVSHMSLVLGGLMSCYFFGKFGVIVMMLGHGLNSSGLFFLANLMYERFYSRNMMILKGLGNLFPSLMLFWVLMSFINMSAPPFMNILGEICLMVSIMKWSFFTAFLLAFMSFFCACYSIYMYSYTQHGNSYFVGSYNMIFLREYFIVFLHLFPLFIYLMKVEFFMFV